MILFLQSSKYMNQVKAQSLWGLGCTVIILKFLPLRLQHRHSKPIREQQPNHLTHLNDLLLFMESLRHSLHNHTLPGFVSNAPPRHSILLRSLPLKATGRRATTANTARSPTLARDQASDVDVSLCRVVPACTNTNDGGATPVDGEEKEG
ncbi:hypothetical protein EGW08_012230 [Elysia chlorotica]|uniref:Uncharacterized protein n=1 Tax=Elysia chlorotica TaxID=188477 RepID=A0A433TEK2_ELYCH|nr:hypothetical protein EGW08_012230 [Elysia chlorotica]